MTPSPRNFQGRANHGQDYGAHPPKGQGPFVGGRCIAEHDGPLSNVPRGAQVVWPWGIFGPWCSGFAPHRLPCSEL